MKIEKFENNIRGVDHVISATRGREYDPASHITII